MEATPVAPEPKKQERSSTGPLIQGISMAQFAGGLQRFGDALRAANAKAAELRTAASPAGLDFEDIMPEVLRAAFAAAAKDAPSSACRNCGGELPGPDVGNWGPYCSGACEMEDEARQ